MTSLCLLIAAGWIAACAAAPGASPSPTPGAADPLAAFVAALTDAGVEARESGPFTTAGWGGRGVALCVNGETVNVIVFDAPEAAVAFAGTINPRDPSQIGRSMVDWVAPPKFWLSGPLVVYYIGATEEIMEALLDTLGAPFAVAPGIARVDLPGC